MVSKIYCVTALLMCLVISSCHALKPGNHLKGKVELDKAVGFCELSLTDDISRDEIKVSGVHLGMSKEEVQQILGASSKTRSHDNELSNDVHTLLYYNDSYFEFKADKLVSFDLHDSSFKLEYFDITVGTDLSECENLSDYKSNKVRVQVQDADEAVLLELDSNRVIKSIYYWVNW